MKEGVIKEEDEEGLAQYLDALDLDWHSQDNTGSPAPKNRAGSAPPTFDSSSLFLYMEDDVYTRSFTKGFLNTRKDNMYSEFYEQYKHKNPTMPPPFFQEDFVARDSKNSSRMLVSNSRKLSAISSVDDDYSSPSPSHSPNNRSRKMSTFSSNLADAKRNAEAMIRGLDESDLSQVSLDKEDSKTTGITVYATGDIEEKLEAGAKSPGRVSPPPGMFRGRRGSPLRATHIPAEPIDEVGEYDSTPLTQSPAPPMTPPKTTNIQSQFVVINNYNNYNYPPPFPPMAPSNAPYNLYQHAPAPSHPYMPYYYPYPPTNYPMPAPPPPYFPYKPREPKEAEKPQENDIDKLLAKVEIAARDQTSCRLLQKKLEEGNKSFTNKIFSRLITSIGSYMNDPFGNYLCQKLFDQCDSSQIALVIDHIATEVVNIATDLHGTRAIQKVIEKSVADSTLLAKVTELLKGHIAKLVMDNNGNHVVQQCLLNIKAPYNEFIYKEVMESCLAIATHKHGCCVLQKCLDFSNETQKKKLIDRIVQYTQAMVRDQYGNYVIQYVIDLKNLDINGKIVDKLKGTILELSNEKFSSNVIEKCLDLNHYPKKHIIIMEILQAETYVDMLLNPYGNYVIQKALSEAMEPELSILIKKVKANLPEIKKRGDFGRKIYTKLVKTFPALMEKPGKRGGKQQH